jgi:hypothetical protein
VTGELAAGLLGRQAMLLKLQVGDRLSKAPAVQR